LKLLIYITFPVESKYFTSYIFVPVFKLLYLTSAWYLQVLPLKDFTSYPFTETFDTHFSSTAHLIVTNVAVVVNVSFVVGEVNVNLLPSTS
jgi:hypothetical protein